MKLEERGNQKSEPSSEDWDQLRLRLTAVEARHKKLVAQIPGYKIGDCVYQHFFGNGMKSSHFLLKGLSGVSQMEAYRQCLEIVTQIERYQRLLESNPEFAQRECSQPSSSREYFSPLKSYLDQVEEEL